MKLRPLIATVLHQVRADLRPQLLGLGVFSLLVGPLVIVVIARFLDGPVREQIPVAFGAYLVAGSVGAFGAMAAMQISSEMATERFSGLLLRVRTLPHGVITWPIGKAISTAGVIVLSQVLLLIGAVVVLDGFSLTPTAIILLVGVIVLSVASATPLGFIIGTFNRGSYTMLLTMALIMALFITSGGPFPLTALPTWVQGIQLALPFYWSGQLSRQVLLGDLVAPLEFTGSFQPAIAIGVLLAWAIGGFAIAGRLLSRSFSRMSLGSLAATQSKIQAQTFG